MLRVQGKKRQQAQNVVEFLSPRGGDDGEAFRRSTSHCSPGTVFLMARFGVLTNPKPCTSVLVFGNQDEVNPLPAVDDWPGSPLDAQVLALYVWLNASRSDEFDRLTEEPPAR